jgi:hypothetical protein
MKDTNTQKTGKSGYEIRLEVLQRALDMADSRWHMANEVGRVEAEAKIKLGVASTWTLPPDNRVEEAMQIAEKLYRFVESK